jgi:glutathione peroxidase
MFEKLDVNGVMTSHLVYQFLRSHAPGMQQGQLSSVILWNFAKFLIDKDGKVVKHYKPPFAPMDIKPDIEALINA